MRDSFGSGGDYSLMIVLILVGLMSCSGHGDGIWQPTPLVTHRMVFPFAQGNGDYVYANGEYNAQAPFAVSAYTSYQGEFPGRDAGIIDYVTTIEIDYGDGGGWEDVTARRLLWDDRSPATWEQHTYTTPGEYDLNMRVTYWDGEVVYQPAELAKRVIITEPNP